MSRLVHIIVSNDKHLLIIALTGLIYFLLFPKISQLYLSEFLIVDEGGLPSKLPMNYSGILG